MVKGHNQLDLLVGLLEKARLLLETEIAGLHAFNLGEPGATLAVERFLFLGGDLGLQSQLGPELIHKLFVVLLMPVLLARIQVGVPVMRPAPTRHLEWAYVHGLRICPDLGEVVAARHHGLLVGRLNIELRSLLAWCVHRTVERMRQTHLGRLHKLRVT